MYKVYFSNFNYYSYNTAESIEGAKKIARAAGFDSVIEFNGEPVCTYCAMFGFRNIYETVIGLDRTG